MQKDSLYGTECLELIKIHHTENDEHNMFIKLNTHTEKFIIIFF
jgi:hypothetical protein